MKKVKLHPKREEAIARKHPWIFSGAITATDPGLVDGDLVEVVNSKDQFLAIGHWQEGGSIAVRVISFENTPIDENFWRKKIQNAVELRQKVGLISNPATNCFRLVHAEGDGLPGLVMDIYGKTVVLQCHSIGMYQQKEAIAQAVLEVLSGKVEAVYNKSRETLPDRFATSVKNSFLIGHATEKEVMENGHKFNVNWEEGQKTGFYLDQRENRQLLTGFASGKSVLNAFCYSGGFSVYALTAGAREVHSVDVSAKAIGWTLENVALNGDFPQHQAYAEDVLHFLKNTSRKYEVMVVDPPAFAKNLNKRHNAVQGYKRLNAMAMEKLEPGGILFTFSCSQVIDRQLFYDTIVAAALEAKREARVLRHLSQPPDHPVNLFHPEGAYLKGLVLEIK